MIRSLKYPHWPAHAGEVMGFLGVKRLPVEGMAPRDIQGYQVYVRPLDGRLVGCRRNFQGLRVMVVCKCGEHVALGRLVQHEQGGLHAKRIYG